MLFEVDRNYLNQNIKTNSYLMIDDPNTEVTRCFAAEYNAEELS